MTSVKTLLAALVLTSVFGAAALYSGAESSPAATAPAQAHATRGDDTAHGAKDALDCHSHGAAKYHCH